MSTGGIAIDRNTPRRVPPAAEALEDLPGNIDEFDQQSQLLTPRPTPTVTASSPSVKASLSLGPTPSSFGRKLPATLSPSAPLKRKTASDRVADSLEASLRARQKKEHYLHTAISTLKEFLPAEDLIQVIPKLVKEPGFAVTLIALDDEALQEQLVQSLLH